VRNSDLIVRTTVTTSVTTTHTYPLDAWQIVEDRFDLESNVLDETIFAQANGYIGLRGAHEEGFDLPPGRSIDGAFLNGFFEAEPIVYPETAYGFARTKQFMLNVPNAKRITLEFDGERFALTTGEIKAYTRTLDLRTGLVTRAIDWISPRGHRVTIHSRRLVSLSRKHVFAVQYAVTSVDFTGTVRLTSTIEGRVKNIEAGDDPRVGSTITAPPLVLQAIEAGDAVQAMTHRTRNSGFSLVSAISHAVTGGRTPRHAILQDSEAQRVGLVVEAELHRGETITLTKVGAYVTSRDVPVEALSARAQTEVVSARSVGFDHLAGEQAERLAAYWADADIAVDGDEALQQGIRFNLFHLLQSVGRDGRTNIAAKGLTGEGYEGHYFWDTEIYIFPVFLFTQPEIARKLLEYRYSILPFARRRARQMGHPSGALFPWRTIAGEECSAYFPAGSAQYHINADIAYAIKLYDEVSGDSSFLREAGAEIVMDTARIWLGLGRFVDRLGGQFGIFEVTGPDEYTACVNNNFYTNAMAQMHLAFAADVAERLQRDHPEDFTRIATALDLGTDEPLRWREAAQRMYLPVDEVLGIHPQDDSFLDKPVWDFAGTPREHYPLLLHFHPLVIYRHRVLKQADVVLALMLLSDKFTLAQKKRDYDYYEPLTTHDSSLSSCIYSIIGSEIGYHDQAYAFFLETARMDLDNKHGNTPFGAHLAAMAGAWLSLVYGFGGLRSQSGQLRFAPYLPGHWTHYRFSVRAQDRRLDVNVDAAGVTYRLRSGATLTLMHHDQPVTLTAEQPEQFIAD